jgi:enoyl-CoA hydratase/carnithine racemase
MTDARTGSTGEALTGGWRYLRVALEGGVATVTLDHPPINLLTVPFLLELARLGEVLAAAPDARAVIVRSALPDFFVAHFDVEAILRLPHDAPPVRGAPNAFHAMCERWRTLPQATLAQVEGRVGGGGSEWIQALDMRFGVRGRTVVSQMEVAVGILPGGGGTQRLPRLVGRGRALELVLGAGDLDAETAERWGLLNRAFAPGEIAPFVERLARRIASFPPEAVRLAKQAVDAAVLPLPEGLAEESFLFETLLRTPEAREAMQRFLAQGGQTRDVELHVGEWIERLGARGGGG